jgi:hypothetical protein
MQCLQLMLTGILLSASAVVAAVIAAKFLEYHSATELLGICAATRHPRFEAPPQMQLNASAAARDCVLGVASGTAGDSSLCSTNFSVVFSFIALFYR